MNLKVNPAQLILDEQIKEAARQQPIKPVEALEKSDQQQATNNQATTSQQLANQQQQGTMQAVSHNAVPLHLDTLSSATGALPVVIAQYFNPTWLGKQAPTAFVPEQVEDDFTAEGEEHVSPVQHSQGVDPRYVDTMISAQQSVVFTIRESQTTPLAPYGNVSRKRTLSDLLGELNADIDAGRSIKKQKSEDSRYIDTIASAIEKEDEDEEEPFKDLPLEEDGFAVVDGALRERQKIEAEEKPSWGKQIVSVSSKVANQLWSSATKLFWGSKEEEIVGEPEAFKPAPAPQTGAPLPVRPQVDDPQITMEQAKLQRLLGELRTLAGRLYNNSLDDEEEKLRGKAVDIVMHIIIKEDSEGQHLLTVEMINSDNDLFKEMAKESNRVTDTVVNLRNKLNGRADIAEYIGIFNIGATITMAAAGVALVFVSGGLAVIPMIIGGVASVAGGGATIAEGVINFQSGQDRGELLILQVRRQENDHRQHSAINDIAAQLQRCNFLVGNIVSFLQQQFELTRMQ